VLLDNDGDLNLHIINGSTRENVKNAGDRVLFSDLDNDGWPDIHVANDSTPHLLFHNNHNGTFF
jgi:hypothetical protein